jgi:hypothetical protein
LLIEFELPLFCPINMTGSLHSPYKYAFRLIVMISSWSF